MFQIAPLSAPRQYTSGSRGDAYGFDFTSLDKLQRAMIIGSPGSSIMDLVTPPKILSRSRE